MKKTCVLLTVLAITYFVSGTGYTQKEQAKEQTEKGEVLFKQHCAACHFDGGNAINPQKTLHQKDREANGVKTTSDIVGKTRNPGPGMTQFDETTLPDKDAQAIAEYILKTFK